MARATKAPTEQPPAYVPVVEIADWDSEAPIEISPVQIRAILEDRVVRAVREAGHCREADGVMKKAFQALEARGKSSRDRGDWRDSDGTNCWGDTWRDSEGYDRNGYGTNGRDREGYDREGYDARGFNREGLDREGLTATDPARFRYNVDGYDAEGFNRSGVNRKGQTKQQAELSKLTIYDAEGYDPDGYTKWGELRGGGSYSAEHEFGNAQFDIVALVTRWRAEGRLPNDDGTFTVPAPATEAPAETA